MEASAARAERDGILILVLAAFVFSLFSLAGKAVSDAITEPQLIVVRSVIMLPVLGIWAIKQGQPLMGRKKGLLLLRGIVGTASLYLFFFSLKRLPLGDTVLIFQIHPLVVAALAPLMLGEHNRPVHWLLLGFSCVGVGLVVGPTGTGSWEGRLAAFACCVLAAIVFILVRMLRRTEGAVTIAFTFPIVSLLMFGPPFLFDAPGFEWHAPSAGDWFFLTAMAVSAAVGQVLLSLGLGKVPAARGTGLSNLQVAFALIYGLVFFHEIPTLVTVGGAILIVASQVLLARVRPAHLERRHIV